MKLQVPARVVEPIILLGAGRSGTTVVADVLGAHPDALAAYEPRLVWRYGNDHRSDQLRPEHATDAIISHIHSSFAADLVSASAQRLVEKTPGNSLRPYFVDAVFPDARYIHVTRSGWAAVPAKRDFWQRRATGLDARQLSKLRRRLREARPRQLPFYGVEFLRRISPFSGRHVALYGPRPAGIQQVADELGRLEAAAFQWRACVERSAVFGRNLPAGRYLEVHLEALDTDRIAEIAEFCGLSPDPVVMNMFRQQFRPEAARRQPPMTDEERTIIAPYVVPANAYLGYAEQSADVLNESLPP